MHSTQLSLLLFSVVALSGCVRVAVDKPVGTPSPTSEFKAALEGVWIGPEQKSWEVKVTDGPLPIHITELKTDGDTRDAVITTTAAGTFILWIEDKEISAFLPVRLSYADDALALICADYEEIEKLIDAGAIAGRKDPDLSILHLSSTDLERHLETKQFWSLKAVAPFIRTSKTLAAPAWMPPTKPDPHAILDEARADARSGRYEEALAKHVWFHENALKFKPSLYGVRLSFALGDWARLGESYPPALERLKTIRDAAAESVRKKTNAREAFHDFSSINQTLSEDRLTTELFIWLDAHHPTFARDVFMMARSALVKAGEYQLCARYIDPDPAFESIMELYRIHKKHSETGKHTARIRSLADTTFEHETATLVALLVLSDRKDAADRIATRALAEWHNPQFVAALEGAKTGKVPRPRF